MSDLQFSTSSAAPSNVVHLSSRRKCEENVRSGRRSGRQCVFPATYYSRAQKKNVCGAHAQSLTDAKPGTGPSWVDDQSTPKEFVSLERASEGNFRAIDSQGRLVAVILRDGDQWRAFVIPITFGGENYSSRGATPAAAIEGAGYRVSASGVPENYEFSDADRYRAELRDDLRHDSTAFGAICE